MHKILSLLFCTVCFAAANAQLTGANNGLTATSNIVGLGGTLSNSATSIDFGSSNSSSSILFKKGTSNYFFIGNDGSIGMGTTSPGSQLQMTIPSASQKGLLIKAAASQTGNLAEWQDASGTTLFAVASNGYIRNSIYNFYPVEFNRARNGIYVRYGLALAAANAPEATEVGRGMFGRDDGSEVGMYTYDGDMGFYAGSMTAPKLCIKKLTQNVGIGTSTPNTNAKLDVNGNIFSSGAIAIGTTDMAKIGTYSLAVNGNAIFNKVKVQAYSVWSDYVFEPTYNLIPLGEVEKYIRENRHLPGVPSAKEVEDNGLDVGDNQAVLLKKIEELTLYIIDQNKKIENQQEESRNLLDSVKLLQEELKAMKKQVVGKQ